MKINFKQPKYVLPLLAMPFLCLFFYVFHGSAANKQKVLRQTTGLNGSVGEVSQNVKNRNLTTKMDAFRNTYKETGGASAVTAIPAERSSDPVFIRRERDRRQLDSIDRLMKQRFSQPAFGGPSPNDQALAAALYAARHPQQPGHAQELAKKSVTALERDPMDVFKQQMAYMDSISKENDPAYKAERLKRSMAADAAKAKAAETSFSVTKASADDEGFNTVRPQTNSDFIKAIIDENVTGYAGSRLRIRLLDDIKAGGFLIPKGTYLYALISGFSGQRVTLSVQSVMNAGRIFPVKLQVYDLDGLPGLYIPESAFRDFTRDLGGNTIQGVSIDGGSSGSQFIMSSVAKIFQSTSSAITELIRKNKAKLKYSSYIYLIDSEGLQREQKSY